MTTGNENSPLTRSASGQKNGTAIEARGLSSADNGMTAENISQRKSPDPELASEAADQRPSTENSTAVGIVDAQAASGNGTSSKVGRADALTRESIEAIARKYAGAYFSGLLFQDADSFARFSDDLILAASPLEQPAAAPNDSGTVSVACFSGSYPHGTITYSQLAPSPADERAAFEVTGATEALREYLDAEETWRIVTDVEDPDEIDPIERTMAASRRVAAREAARKVLAARTASANETVAEGAAIPAGYALVPIERSYDMRAKALIAFNTTEQSGKDRDDALDAAYRAELAAAPQPAQADARVGLTDDLRQRCRELLELNEKGESPQVALRVLADMYHPDISAHDRRSMAVSQTHIEALRALLAAHPGQPEPRAEATDDWISVTAQRPCDAGIASCDDVLAWNNDPGFPTIVEAHFVSPGFPEYTHWKHKPIGPANAARTGASS
ncbi:hypothetical protein E9536_20055 [Burkholderia sp. LS-044]|uniref:hypothetical protein n=1 Tax=Burkholderia sp. LS-044 TaxID=1459967 RepID=UPI0010A66687|nr:hypothetical protein [Burkholderia sp. LS-044]THJ52560.1 hypothetical protein E9536_20055 [Burkholderia sp. LS-044]